ncbi:hypothetical protein D3C72_2173710 [compost metagenome]
MIENCLKVPLTASFSELGSESGPIHLFIVKVRALTSPSVAVTAGAVGLATQATKRAADETIAAEATRNRLRINISPSYFNKINTEQQE